MASPQRFRLSARLRSLRYALAGLRVMLATQHNAWVHAAASVMVIVAGFAFGVSRGEWLALVVVITGVWVAEAFNTALEALADVVSPQFHPLVKRAKDVAAGAVLCAALGALVVGLIVFAPRLFAAA